MDAFPGTTGAVRHRSNSVDSAAYDGDIIAGLIKAVDGTASSRFGYGPFRVALC